MADPTSVTCPDGRKFDLATLTPADVLDLYDAAEDSAGNPAWVRYALMICCVSAIDGVPVPRPVNKKQIKALGNRIGNAGVATLHRVLFGDGSGEEEVAEESAPSPEKTPQP